MVGCPSFFPPSLPPFIIIISLLLPSLPSLASAQGRRHHDVHVYVDGMLKCTEAVQLPTTPAAPNHSRQHRNRPNTAPTFRFAFGRPASRWPLIAEDDEHGVPHSSGVAQSRLRIGGLPTSASPQDTPAPAAVMLDRSHAHLPYHRLRCDLRGLMGHMLLFVGPVASPAQALKLFEHQRKKIKTRTTDGGAAASLNPDAAVRRAGNKAMGGR